MKIRTYPFLLLLLFTFGCHLVIHAQEYELKALGASCPQVNSIPYFAESNSFESGGNIIFVGRQENSGVNGNGTYYTDLLGQVTSDIQNVGSPLRISAFSKDCGALLWNKWIAQAYNECCFAVYPLGVSPDNNGDFLIYGTFWGIGDFDPGPGELIVGNADGPQIAFIAKYDQDGNLVWFKTLEGSYNYTIGTANNAQKAVSYPNGDFLICLEQFDDPNNLNPENPITLNVNGIDTEFSIFNGSLIFLRINTDGDIIQAYQTFADTDPTPSLDEVTVLDMTLDADGRIIVSIWARESVWEITPEDQIEDVYQTINGDDKCILFLNEDLTFNNFYDFGDRVINKPQVDVSQEGDIIITASVRLDENWELSIPGWESVVIPALSLQYQPSTTSSHVILCFDSELNYKFYSIFHDCVVNSIGIGDGLILVPFEPRGTLATGFFNGSVVNYYYTPGFTRSGVAIIDVDNGELLRSTLNPGIASFSNSYAVDNGSIYYHVSFASFQFNDFDINEMPWNEVYPFPNDFLNDEPTFLVKYGPKCEIASTVIENVNELVVQAEEETNVQWLNCRGDNIIIDADSDTLTYLESGSFAAQLTSNLSCCIDTTECIQVEFTGVENLDKGDITVYPNPGNGQFTVSNLSPQTQLRLIASDGREMDLSGKVQVFGNLATFQGDLPTGTYVLSGYAEGELLWTRRVVVVED